jgi:hypothetical protein
MEPQDDVTYQPHLLHDRLQPPPGEALPRRPAGEIGSG